MTDTVKKILVVEDDDDIREVLMELLGDAGHEVASAVNGRAALNLLALDSNFNLILLDLMMPVMDGFAFRAEQSKDPRISEIPVVVMSADGHVTEKMKRANAREYVTKPVDMLPLLETVARNLK